MKELFKRCLAGPWTKSGDDVHYRIEREGKKLILTFPGTWDAHGWLHDFDIAITLYKDMRVPFMVHRGFAQMWHSVRDEIMGKIKADTTVTEILCLGYSQGAALATLAHEDCGFQLPATEVSTVAFASPRLLWLPLYKGIVERFREVRRWSVRGDIVTQVPPAIMGYQHIGVDNKVGPVALPSAKNHYPDKYEECLP